MEGDAVLSSSHSLHQEAERAQRQLDRGTEPAGLLFSQVHWRIANDTHWDDKFYTTIATVPSSEGRTEMGRVKKSISNKPELRLLRAGPGDDDWLASFKGDDSLALLCPKTGLWVFDVQNARHAFTSHMNEHYGSLRNEDFLAYVVPLPTLAHTTWVGPPNSQRKDARGGKLKIRPDIDGPRLIAHGLARADQRMMAADRRWTDIDLPHRLIFHCFKAHRPDFEALFASTDVRVWAIEDQVPAPAANLTYAPMTESALPSTVHHVMTTSRDLQQPNRPKREYVNAKNMWSYYSIWRYGGYHMDTGVFPASTMSDSRTKKPRSHPNPRVGMPEPTDFGIVNERGGRKVMRLQLERWVDHKQFGAVAFGTDAMSMFPTPSGKVGDNKGSSPASLVVRAREDGQYCDFYGDVWLMRSNRGGRTALEATMYFAQFWFFMQSLRGDEPQGAGITFNSMPDASEDKYRGASRVVVVAAALSALAPESFSELWKQGSLKDLVGDRAIPAAKPDDRGGVTVPELGLDKTFFGSHR